MDGNKDDALKCLRIGKNALELGDRTRALKFLSKARRLDPSLLIDDLLDSAQARGDGSPRSENPRAESEGSPAGSSSPSSPTSFSTTTRAKARARAKATTTTVSSNEPSKDYTEEQFCIVQQIKKKKDYYQILGIERGCTVEDVRKAYRKLSLKVHPDKNKATGAEEAFKAVSKAFQCLSNEETKKRYDLVGSEEPNYRRAPARQHSHNFNGFYDEGFDPDEIFRNFFYGGGVPQATTPFGSFHFRTGGMGMPNGNGVQGSGNFRALLQILPIILLILLNFLPSSDPVYMLSRQHPYEYKLETPRGVPYFVKSSAKCEQDYPYNSSERTHLEYRVERDYVSVLSQNCRVELQRRQWGLTNKMPNCDMLDKFQATA